MRLSETPSGVSSSVNFGSLGWLEIEPSAKLSVEFQEGVLLPGCVTLHTKAGTTGEVDSPKGVIGTTESEGGGFMRTCNKEGSAALAPVSVAQR